MPWEIRGPWPSIQEVEWRFEELIRLRWGPAGARTPADVFVLGDQLWVEIDVPGVAASDVRAWTEGDRLLVEGTRRDPPPGPGARPTLLERTRGPFRRSFSLPPGFGSGRLEMGLADGVLRLHLTREPSP